MHSASTDGRDVGTLGPAGMSPVPLTDLTEREREVLALRAAGRLVAEIAEALVVEPRTVRFHLRRIYAKLGVPGHSQVSRQRALADHAQRLGVLPQTASVCA